VDVDADSVTLTDAVSAGTVTFDAQSVNRTLSMATAGIGGIQSGSSETNSTWYAVYVVGKTSDGSINGQLVPYGTAFAFESGGWDVRHRTGWVYNDGSGNLLNFYQYGRNHHLNLGIADLAGGSSASFAAVTLSVPPSGVHEAHIFFAGLTSNFSLSLDGTNVWNTGGTLTGANFIARVPINSSKQIWYRRDAGAGTLDIDTVGWIDNI